jgi:hypothetical protein
MSSLIFEAEPIPGRGFFYLSTKQKKLPLLITFYFRDPASVSGPAPAEQQLAATAIPPFESTSTLGTFP